MMSLDIRKKLQDQADEIIKDALIKSGTEMDKQIVDFMTGLTVLALKQGFIWGVTSCKQTSEYLLNDIKGNT